MNHTSMQRCGYRGKLRKESECMTEMKAMWKKRGYETPACCDDLHSKFKELSKNSLEPLIVITHNIWITVPQPVYTYLHHCNSDFI